MHSIDKNKKGAQGAFFIDTKTKNLETNSK